MIKVDKIIDVKGLLCPRPLLVTKQTLKTMHLGEILQVITDDVSTKHTFTAYLNGSGDELLDMHQDGLIITCYIKKK